jgi:hypothetical protein
MRKTTLGLADATGASAAFSVASEASDAAIKAKDKVNFMVC